MAVEEIGGSMFQISGRTLLPRIDIASGIFESSQIAVKVATRNVRNVPLLVFVDTTQTDRVLDLQLYALIRLEIALPDSGAIKMDESPLLSLTALDSSKGDELDSVSLVSYALLSNGRSFEVKDVDGLELQSLTSLLRVQTAQSASIAVPNKKSDKAVLGFVAATWASCSSLISKTAVPVRVHKGFVRNSLKLAFELIDNDSLTPTQYLSDQKSIFLGLAYPPLPTSCKISEIRILDEDDDLISTLDPMDAGLKVFARSTGLSVESAGSIKASASALAGDVTVCVAVSFRKHQVEGCRTVTLASLTALRVRGLPWPVPVDISKEKNTLFRLDGEGRMQSLQLNVSVLTTEATEHDISHLCSPQLHCNKEGCKWYALDFEIDDESGGASIACGKLTLGKRARLDHSRLPMNLSSVDTVRRKLSVTALLVSGENPEGTADHSTINMRSSPYEIHVSPEQVDVVQVKLSLPSALHGTAGDTFEAAYKIVVQDRCVSTSCFLVSARERAEHTRVPCSYAGPGQIVQVGEAAPCNYSITSEYLEDSTDGLVGLCTFSSSDIDTVFVHSMRGTIKLLQNSALPVRVCITAADVENCIRVTVQSDVSDKQVGEALPVDEKQAGDQVERTLVTAHPFAESSIQVSDIVAAGESCQILLLPPATFQDGGGRAEVNRALSATIAVNDEHNGTSLREFFLELSEDRKGAYVSKALMTRSGNYYVDIFAGGRRLNSDSFHVKVVPGTWDLKVLHLVGHGLVGGLVRSKMTFSIIEKDSFGNILPTGPGGLEYQVSVLEQAIAPVLRRDGARVHATYEPAEAGALTLWVRQNGLHLAGSPFHVEVVRTAGEAVGAQTILRCSDACDGIGAEECQDHCSAGIEMTAGIKKPISVLARDILGIATTPKQGLVVSPHDDFAEVSRETDASQGLVQSFALLATISGEFRLSVTLDSAHISGSPFPVHVLPGEASASASIAVLPYSESCEVGHTGRLSLKVADSYGNRKRYLDVSPEVSAILSGPSTVTAINELRDGTQELTWVSTRSGSYEITVFVLGSEIPQSPLPVSIGPGQVSPLHSVVVSGQRKEVAAGRLGLTGIVLRDQYANAIPFDKSVIVRLESVQHDGRVEL